MPKPYPDPNLSNIEGIYKYSYTVTDGYISVLFMVACLIVLFLLLKSKFYRVSDSLALSSFLTMILCSFLWALGYFPGKFIVLLIILLLAGIVWGMFEQ
jgi:hypothetical protein